MALDFAAGCFGGCAGLVVGYPLDTIKVHIQTQDGRNPRFRGTWHCFRSILATESITGFYRGMTSPMAGVAFINALIFGAYGEAQRHSSNPDDLSTHFLAGAAAGLAQSPVAAPLELAKTRMQLQSTGSHRYSGPIQCLRDIYRRAGLAGVFRGLGITALREAPSYGIYFLTYESLTRTESTVPTSTVTMLIAGGLAGTASWVFTYPIDVIKSRLQADLHQRYLGSIDCLKKSIRDEGVSCLFRGLNSTIIRAFPTNAATFAVVHWTFRLCGQDDGHKKEESVGLGVSVVQETQESVSNKWSTFVNMWNGDAYANSFFLAIARRNSTAGAEDSSGGGKGGIVESDTATS
ncbi:mitochondrial basic amino acids transporter [Diachasma alloeum]|uniref:mitochondrial basic amino acids transporter n=1 Tax=Diachasma alloeum TaxID=454923 RepID=UPI0007381ED3|nr:mitochondrial basic amino acids transporter [Diachasma alloeum]